VPAGAQAPDTTDTGPSPFNRAVRSAVVPAWGQLTNGREVKAGILFSVEAYVWTRVVIHSRRGREWEDRADALEADGAPAAEVALARRQAEEQFGTRRDMLFWAFVGSFYGAIDAYIDAHLVDFEKELEDGKELFAGVGTDGLQLGIRF
jgi:hypothetical protein